MNEKERIIIDYETSTDKFKIGRNGKSIEPNNKINNFNNSQ
jgi:hypothetical protein